MSNLKILGRNVLVWLLAGSFWTFLGFQTTDIKWFSILMFIGGGFCALQALLQVVMLMLCNKNINKLDNFPDALK